LTLCGRGISPNHVEDLNTVGVLAPPCPKCYKRYAQR